MSQTKLILTVRRKIKYLKRDLESLEHWVNEMEKLVAQEKTDKYTRPQVRFGKGTILKEK